MKQNDLQIQQVFDGLQKNAPNAISAEQLFCFQPQEIATPKEIAAIGHGMTVIEIWEDRITKQVIKAPADSNNHRKIVHQSEYGMPQEYNGRLRCVIFLPIGSNYIYVFSNADLNRHCVM
jgi:hypothetical protein